MVIIDPTGFAMTYPKPLTISSHTLGAIKGAPLPWYTRWWLQVQGRIHSKFGRSVGLAIGNINLPIASMSALVQMIIPPPKFQFDELVPTAPLVSSLQLHRLMLIERGDALLRELSVEEAFEVLSENTEDAYGFPPYPRIGHALANGDHKIEADIRRQMIGNLEAVHLRTPDRNWFELLPILAAGLGSENAARVSVGADGTLVIDVTDTDTNVLTIGSDRRPGVLANRFEKLSPQEAEEVEEALSGALSLLQKVSDILEGDNEREPAVSGLVASVRSLRDARMPQPKD
jgi:hypothetical protein